MQAKLRLEGALIISAVNGKGCVQIMNSGKECMLISGGNGCYSYRMNFFFIATWWHKIYNFLNLIYGEMPIYSLPQGVLYIKDKGAEH